MDFKNLKLRISEGYLVCGRKRFHRMVWESVHGEIPKGYDIHHKDGNKLNNAIDNLECLTHSAHLSIHMKLNKKLYDWHKTDVGRKFCSERAKKVWKNRKVHTLKCLECGAEFEAKQIDRAKYCDNKCEQRARRKRGDDLIERKCIICLKPFSINRYHNTLTCGYTCGGKLKSQNAAKRKH